MRALALVALAALAGCSSPVEDAKRQLAMIEKAHGSKTEICAAKRKVADAYLKAQNQADYESARLDAATACNAAQLERLER